MHTRLTRAAALAATALFTCASAWAGDFTSSYTAGYTSYTIKGSEPASGTHPVFIYTVGTTESYDNAQAMAAVAEMVAKGFVAATVRYDSGSFGTCSQILAKAKSIYNAASTSSAVAKLCSRATADCSKGIVVAGFSQGSVIAVNAKNFDSRVRAAYGMGTHNKYSSYDLSSCMNDGAHVLPSTNLRIVSGEVDTYAGGTASAVRTASEGVTGKSCGSTAYQCLSTNGSGWVMIRGSQVGDGKADHCYQRASGGCLGSQSTVDSAWRNGTDNWGLKANLNWLNTFVTH